MISGDVYGLFFTREAIDQFKLNKEEFALVKEQKEKQDKEKKEAEEKSKSKSKESVESSKKDSTKVEVKIDWDNLTERKLKLTQHTSPAGDWILSKDNEKLFYLTAFEKGNDLWETELRTKETKLLAKLGVRSASMELSFGRKVYIPVSRWQGIQSGR